MMYPSRSRPARRLGPAAHRFLWIGLLLASRLASLRTHAAEGIPEWIQQLRSHDYPTYQSAVAHLRKQGAAAVPHLLKAFQGTDWDLRNGASVVLAEIGKPAVPILAQGVREATAGAIEALIDLGPAAADAVPVLRECLLANPSRDPRNAASALAAIGNPGVPALIAGLRHGDPQVREVCVSRLGWIRTPPYETAPELATILFSEPALRDQASRSLRRIRFQSKELERQLRDKASSPDPEVRHGAILGLSAARNPEPGTLRIVMTVAREDREVRLRTVALEALGWMAPTDHGVAKVLKEAIIRDTEWEPVQSAAMALAQMDIANEVETGFADLLKPLSLERRGQVASILVRSMSATESALAVPLLQEGLNATDPLTLSQTAAVLGMVGPHARETAPAIAAAIAEDRLSILTGADALRRLESQSPEVVRLLRTQLAAHLTKEERRKQLGKPAPRYATSISETASLVEALGASGPAAREALPAIWALSKDADPLVRAAVAGALARIDTHTQAVVDLVVAQLHDDAEPVRPRALLVLGKLGPLAARAVPELIRTLENPEERIATQCAWALGQIGSPDSVTALEKSLHVRSPSLRISAASALLRLRPGHTLAWKALTAELDNHWAGLRVEAMYHLGEMGPAASAALDGIIPCLDHSIDSVRAAAAEALGKMGRSATRAIPKLRTAAEDTEPNVRRAGIRALRQIEPPRIP